MWLKTNPDPKYILVTKPFSAKRFIWLHFICRTKFVSLQTDKSDTSVVNANNIPYAVSMQLFSHNTGILSSKYLDFILELLQFYSGNVATLFRNYNRIFNISIGNISKQH